MEPFREAAANDGYAELLQRMLSVRDPQNPDFVFLDDLPRILNLALLSKGFEVNSENLAMACDQINPETGKTISELGLRGYDDMVIQAGGITAADDSLSEEPEAAPDLDLIYEGFLEKAKAKGIYSDGTKNLHEVIRDNLAQTLRLDPRYSDVKDDFAALNRAQDSLERVVLFQAKHLNLPESHAFWQHGGIIDLVKATRLKIIVKALIAQDAFGVDPQNIPRGPLQ